MKKQLLLLTTFLTVCLPVLSNPVTAEQAREKASLFLNSSTFGKRHKAQALARSLRVASIGENESYYVFNIGEDEGFVIVNGEDDMEEIIGYSEEGNFDAEEMPENMKSWMQSYIEQIEWVRAHKNQITRQKAKANSYEYENFQLDETRVARWGQDYPFNVKCPFVDETQTVTGCAPTALAQLLYWHKQPAMIATTIPEYEEYSLDAVAAGTVIDWTNMGQRWNDYSNNDQRNAVASLMLYCGQALKVTYKVKKDEKGKIISISTSGSSFYTPYVLCKYFGFKDQIEYVYRNDYDNEEWKWLIYSELSKNRPIYYRGRSPEGGHAFLIEGYKDDRFYVNWGWYGSNNGFYKLDLLNGLESNVGFDYSQAALINAEPGGNASLYSARLTTTMLSVDKQSVSRSSAYSNFPSFKATVKVLNENPETLKFKEGFGLFKDGVLVGTAWTKNNKSEFGSYNNAEYSMNIALNSNLEDGIYHLCSTSCESSFDNMKENRNSNKYYIKVTKQGNEVTLETYDPSQANLTVSQFEPQSWSVFKVNRLVGFNITVSNNDTHAYSGDFKLCQVFNKDGKEENRVEAVTHLDINADGAAAFSLRFIPTIEGTRVLRILDKNDKVLSSMSVNIEHGENMEVSDWSIVNGDLLEHVLLGTTLNGSVLIRNNDSQPFDGIVSFELIDTDAYFPHGSNTSKELKLASNEQKEVSFSFDNLKEGHSYIVAVHFDDSEIVSKSESFVCKHLDISALTTGDYFTAETIEGVTVNYIITDINRRTVSVMGVNGETAVDENTSGSVTLPALVNGFLVTAIGDGAFAYLDKITQVYIPTTVKRIGRQAFFYCSELTRVDGMEGVEVIDEIAFRRCGKMRWFNLPNTLTTIGTQAFGSCTSLKAFTLPASVKWLEPNRSGSYKLFEGCDNLKVIKVEEGNPYFDSRENCNAIIETATNTLYAGCGGTTIVDGIESIDEFAFGGLDNIETIEIPASVKNIGKYAFAQSEYYGKLTNVKIYAKEPIAIDNSVFSYLSTKTLYVPSGSKAKYAEANVWKEFGQIKEFATFDQEPIEGIQLVIYFKDGRSLSYLLSDHPRFQLDDAKVIFSTNNVELTFEGKDIDSFVIEDRDESFIPVSVGTIKEDAISRFVEGRLCISGTQPGTSVRIYDINGTMVYAGVTDEYGSLTIDTSVCKPGVYIVNMGQTSVKLMKK